MGTHHATRSLSYMDSDLFDGAADSPPSRAYGGRIRGTGRDKSCDHILSNSTPKEDTVTPSPDSSPPDINSPVVDTGARGSPPKSVVTFGVAEVRVITEPEEEFPLGPMPTGVQLFFRNIFSKESNTAAASLVQLVYQGGLTDETGECDCRFSLSLWSKVKSLVFGSNLSRHRTIRRVAKVVKILRPLLNELRFEVSEEDLRNTTPLGVRFVETAARRIIRKAVDGEYPEISVDRSQCGLVQRLLVRLAPMIVDEDEFANIVGKLIAQNGRI